MRLKNFVTTLAPIIPNELQGKLTFAANYSLNENEVRIFSMALYAIISQLKEDGIAFDSLTNVNAVFTKNGTVELEENSSAFGNHISLAIYAIENLRHTNNERFLLFAFVEELVHHYWCIEDETKVKYKVLQIVQKIDSGITLELIKGWGLNGL